MLFRRLLIFFSKLIILKNTFRNTVGLSECQTDWIQIRPEKMSGLIWVQTVYKGYQQTTIGGRINPTVLKMAKTIRLDILSAIGLNFI